MDQIMLWMEKVCKIIGYISIIGGAGTWIIRQLMAYRKEKQANEEQREKIEAAQRCQLRSSILKLYYRCKDRGGQIRQYEKENYLLEFEAYEALKGDQFIHTIDPEIREFEMIT